MAPVLERFTESDVSKQVNIALADPVVKASNNSTALGIAEPNAMISTVLVPVTLLSAKKALFVDQMTNEA